MAELVVALDLPGAAPALKLAGRLKGTVGWMKVGLELFCAAGPDVIKKLKDSGFKVFLDLKFHDIPNTVAGAVKSAAAAGADMLTLHAAGGAAMLAAAAAARNESAHRPILLGVTMLTSIDAAQCLAATGRPIDRAVREMAALAYSQGLDGVVSSVLEVASVRAATSPGFVCLTPGIRLRGGTADDQSRVATPSEAVAAGADYLVVGRPITKAPDPAAVADKILKDMARGKEVNRSREHG